MNIKGETIQNGEPTPEYPVEIENKTNILLAIEILKKLKTAKHHIQVGKPDGGEETFELPYLSSIEQQAIETVLLELKKKDKVINEMAEWISRIDPTIYCDKEKCNDNCKECVIKEFTNQVEREGK